MTISCLQNNFHICITKSVEVICFGGNLTPCIIRLPYWRGSSSKLCDHPVQFICIVYRYVFIVYLATLWQLTWLLAFFTDKYAFWHYIFLNILATSVCKFWDCIKFVERYDNNVWTFLYGGPGLQWSLSHNQTPPIPSRVLNLTLHTLLLNPAGLVPSAWYWSTIQHVREVCSLENTHTLNSRIASYHKCWARPVFPICMPIFILWVVLEKWTILLGHTVYRQVG